MKLRLILFFGALLLIANIVSAQSEARAKLKIGFIAPLSGPAASYGIAARNGFDMAVNEFAINKFEVIYEDDQYQPAKTVSAFKKLVGVNGVDIVISMASTPSNAIAPLAEQAKIPLFSWANDPKIARGRSYVVITEQSAAVEVRYLSEEVIERRYKKIAFLTSVGDYQYAVTESIKQELHDRLVYSEVLSSEESDFRSVALKIKSKNPTAVGMCLHPGQFGIFAKQLRAIGVNAYLFGCNSMQDPGEITISGGALKDAWFVTVPVDSNFQNRYTDMYGNNNVVSGAAIHYELGKMLSDVVSTEARGIQIIQKLSELGSRKGAIGEFALKNKDSLQYFDIEMIVKSIH